MADIRPADKPGWWIIERYEPAYETYYGWEPPEIYYLYVSPKLRLFDYPGGPARGQISKEEFTSLLKPVFGELVSEYFLNCGGTMQITNSNCELTFTLEEIEIK